MDGAGSFWTRLLVGGTSLAVLASFTSPANGADSPDDRATVAAGATSPEVGELQPTTPLKGEELAPSSLSFTQLTPARRDGKGLVRLSLVPEDATPDRMRQLVVKARVAKGVRWVAPRVAGWRCDTQRRGALLRCARGGVLSGRAVSLDAALKVTRDRKGTGALITGQARWRTGTGARARSWLETGSGRLAIQPRLGVHLKVAGDGRLAIVTGADPQARGVQLVANLSRVAGQQVEVTWDQVRGPKVRFVTDRTVTTDEKQVSQTVLVPRDFDGARTLVFAVRAQSGGQVVTDRARVRITAEQVQGEVAPRDALIAKALKQAPNRLRKYTVVPTPPKVPRLPSPVRLLGPKKGLAGPGQSVGLRIKTDLRVKRVRWVTHPQNGAGSTVVSGKRLTVTTPGVGQGYLRVQAYVRLAGRPTVVRSFTLMPRPTGLKERPTPDDVEEKNRELLCTVATSLFKAKAAGADKAVEVITQDKTVLKITPSKAVIPGSMFPTPGDCSGKGTIEFGRAKVAASVDADFTEVEGTISLADGVKITKMNWTLDEAMYKWVPQSIRTITVAGDVAIGFDPEAPGTWDAINGTAYLQPYSVADLSLTGIPFVPLPKGWSISAKEGAFLQFFKDDDQAAPAGSMKFVQKATGPPAESAASIQLAVIRRKTADGKTRWGQLYGAASNIEVFKSSDGQTVLASGDLVIDIYATGTSANQLNLAVTCGSPKSTAVRTVCPMGNDVYFRDGKLRLSLPRAGEPTSGGYLLSTTIAFGGEESSYVLKAEGAYTSKDSWRLQVKEDVTFDMGPGMAATGFEGVIKQGEETVKGKQKVVMTFNIAATMSVPQFANGVTVKKVSARITNLCEKEETDCQATEVRFKAGVDLTIPAPAGKTINAALTGVYNWTTKGLFFRADAGSDKPVGPEGWNFKSGSIFASRAAYGYCQAQDASQRAPNVWAVGFEGKGTVFGQDTTLTLQFSKEGSCVWGSMGKLDTGAVPTSGVVVSWTSFPKGALVKTGEDSFVKIKANTGSLTGKVDLPDALNDFLGSKGNLEFTGEITGKFEGGVFEIAYNARPKDVTSQGANSFVLTKVALGMRWKTRESAELYAGAEGLLTIKGDPGKQIADSVTPLGVYFGVKAGTKGVSIVLTAGLGRAVPVENAFGVQGLTLREFAASSEFALPPGNVTVKFAADAIMPKAWQSSGFQPGARVALAFSVGSGQPWCIDFQIGIQGQKDISLDVANAGFLVAHYFRLLIAPAGCTVPISASETRTIPAGYGFAFDGYIMGAPIIVALNVGLGNGVTNNFTMQGDLRMRKLELPLVTLSGADGKSDLTVSLDIDTSKRKYDASIDAGILVGYPEWGFGTRIRIQAQLRTSDEKEVTLYARGSSDVRIAGAFMRLDPLTVDLAVPKRTIVPSRAKVAARAAFGIFGVKLLSGEIDMAYDRGYLVQFGVLVGADLDIKIARLTGNLAFRYCLGSIGGSRTRDGELADCSPFRYKASARPGYRIDLGGLIKVFGIKKTYYWNIAEQVGGEGDPAFEPVQPPGPLPGPTVDIESKDLPEDWFFVQNQSAIPLRLGNLDVKFRSLRPAEVKIPRESRSVDPCSTVQVGTEAYRPSPGTYPTAVPLDPVPGGDCGLIGSYTSGEGVKTVPVVCSQRECIADDKQFRFGGPDGSSRDARDQILTQLRQPPGYLPQGAQISVAERLVGIRALLWPVQVAQAPDKYRLSLYAIHVYPQRFTTLTAIEEFPETRRSDAYYYLTERGVLRSSIDGGGSVGKDAALEDWEVKVNPKRQPALVLDRDQIVVYCGPDPSYGVLWTYGRKGYDTPPLSRRCR